VKEDDNWVAISHSNAYTGNTYINGGVLSLSVQNAIGTGTTIIASGGSLYFASSFTGTYANDTAGPGRVFTEAGSRINITGNMAFDIQSH
jgi:autotransporter-associated beta strand protein